MSDLHEESHIPPKSCKMQRSSFELLIHHIDAQVSGAYISPGKAGDHYVETAIDGKFIHRSAPCSRVHRNEGRDDLHSISTVQTDAENSIIHRFDNLQPATPIIVSFALYTKRWTRPGYKLVGTLQFPITNLLSILDKTPAQGEISVVPYRKNVNLRGKLTIAIQLRSIEKKLSDRHSDDSTEMESVSSVSDDDRMKIAGSLSDDEKPQSAPKQQRKKSIARRFASAVMKRQCVLCSLHHLMMKGHFIRSFRKHNNDDDDDGEDLPVSTSIDSHEDREMAEGTPRIVPAFSISSDSSEDLVVKRSSLIAASPASAGPLTGNTKQCYVCSSYYKLVITIIIIVISVGYVQFVGDFAS